MALDSARHLWVNNVRSKKNFFTNKKLNCKEKRHKDSSSRKLKDNEKRLSDRSRIPATV